MESAVASPGQLILPRDVSNALWTLREQGYDTAHFFNTQHEATRQNLGRLSSWMFDRRHRWAEIDHRIKEGRATIVDANGRPVFWIGPRPGPLAEHPCWTEVAR